MWDKTNASFGVRGCLLSSAQVTAPISYIIFSFLVHIFQPFLKILPSHSLYRIAHQSHTVDPQSLMSPILPVRILPAPSPTGFQTDNTCNTLSQQNRGKYYFLLLILIMYGCLRARVEHEPPEKMTESRDGTPPSLCSLDLIIAFLVHPNFLIHITLSTRYSKQSSLSTFGSIFSLGNALLHSLTHSTTPNNLPTLHPSPPGTPFEITYCSGASSQFPSPTFRCHKFKRLQKPMSPSRLPSQTPFQDL